MWHFPKKIKYVWLISACSYIFRFRATYDTILQLSQLYLIFICRLQKESLMSSLKILKVGDKYEIDLKLNTFSCKWFLKHKICKHSLMYSNLYDLNWFGEKFHSNTMFGQKIKRGESISKISIRWESWKGPNKTLNFIHN